MNSIKLCSDCAELFRDAYDVHPVHIGRLPEGAGKPVCKYCGKQMAIPGIYEIKLRRKEKK